MSEDRARNCAMRRVRLQEDRDMRLTVKRIHREGMYWRVVVEESEEENAGE